MITLFPYVCCIYVPGIRVWRGSCIADVSKNGIECQTRRMTETHTPTDPLVPAYHTYFNMSSASTIERGSDADADEIQIQSKPKINGTTTPNRIRKWSPTLLLTGRYPGYLRRSDGMRSFLDSMVVDDISAQPTIISWKTLS